MIDALMSVKLHGRPVQRTSQSGKPFTTFRARESGPDGLFVNGIAFSESAQAALLARDDGDAVALAGALTPKLWTDRSGESRIALDLVVSSVLSVYDVRRKRQAAAEAIS